MYPLLMAGVSQSEFLRIQLFAVAHLNSNSHTDVTIVTVATIVTIILFISIYVTLLTSITQLHGSTRLTVCRQATQC
jgi:hypothetical protein